MLRQTSDGWRDERHLVNPIGQGGNYSEYDMPYRPDPIAAVLIDPSGTQGWAVGGISGAEQDQTADVERYPAEAGEAALGVGGASVPLAPEAQRAGGGGVTTLAFGGGAQCEAPCSDRVETGIGAEAWCGAPCRWRGESASPRSSTRARW